MKALLVRAAPSSTTACRWTTAPRSSRCSPSARAARRRGTSYVYYPDCAVGARAVRPCAISGRSYTIAAGVDVDVGGRRGRAVRRTAASRAGTACTSRTGGCATCSTGSAPTCRTIIADRDIEPGAHVITAEFVAHGPQRGPDDARRHAARSPSTSTARRSAAATIVTQPGLFCLVGDGHLRGPRRRLPRDARPTPRRSRSPAARSTRSSSTSPASATSTTRPRCGAGSSLD